METNVYERPVEPRYTVRWLGRQSLFIIAAASIMAIAACGIRSLASGRVDQSLLTVADYYPISAASTYCWGLVAIALLTMTLVELRWRKPVTIAQYSLSACALGLFFLTLTAFSECMPLAAAFSTVAAATVALIGLFTKGLTGAWRASAVVSAVLTAEFGLLYVLATIDTMSLLVGSLALFFIIAAAMYLTIRLRIENEQLTLKHS